MERTDMHNLLNGRVAKEDSKYTYLHTYILTHNVNLGIQSLKYHKTPSLKNIYIGM